MVHRGARGSSVFAARTRLWHMGPIHGLHELVYRHDGRTFELRFAPMSDRTWLFDWKQIDGTPVPSLNGSISINRFGPLTSYVVRATMTVAGDIVGKLLRESMAQRLAAVSLRSLERSLRAAMR